jgi:UDP-N-acetylglucosamine 2-epimerase
MEDMNILIIGTRPNFIKAYPLYLELLKNNRKVQLILTRQHYDYDLSGIFIDQFNICKKHIYYVNNLESPNNPFYFQSIYTNLIFILQSIKINYKHINVFVFGDVNSTLIGCLSAKYLNMYVIHVEAGLRLKSTIIKEEINRIYTDRYSDLLLTSDYQSLANLKNENLKYKSYFIGNIMYDTLNIFISKVKMAKPYACQFNILNYNYILFTCHRFETITNPAILWNVLYSITKFIEVNFINKIVLFVCHPHTYRLIQKYQLSDLFKSLDIFNCSFFKIIKPVGYVESINLLYYSSMVITDSGGVQEEAEYLGKPAFIIRKESERLQFNNTYDPANSNLADILLEFYNKNKTNQKNSKSYTQSYTHQSVSEKIVKLIQ